MEELRGGANRRRHQCNRSRYERYLGTPSSQPTPPTLPLELSESDIFDTPSGNSPSSPTHSACSPDPTRKVRNHNRSHYGILSAPNENLKTRSGSDNRPVCNHKASPSSASLSSSSSTSPATSVSSRAMIPRRRPPPPTVDRIRFQPQSAPVNVPVMPSALIRRARDLEDVVSEEEEEDNGVRIPPHELVAARQSLVYSSSVVEGAGRTLKGRDLRQVRNAIWQKTGFID